MNDNQISEVKKKYQTVIDMAKKAMNMNLVLQVEYDGISRLVEVHTIGVNKSGRPSMRVYQVGGSSLTGEDNGWKMMTLDKVFKKPRLMSINALMPRPGYSKGDKGMSEIIAEVD